MNHQHDDQIMDYLNGSLSDEDMHAFEQRIMADSAFAQMVFETEETLCQLGLDVIENQPSPQLKARVVQSIQHASAFDQFASKVAELCDFSKQKALDYLDQIKACAKWPLFMPGTHYLDLQSGPALNARAGLVVMESGIHFPQHTHEGQETTYILQGTCHFSDGQVGKAGDLITMPDGSSHSYYVGDGPPLIFLTIIGEIAMSH